MSSFQFPAVAPGTRGSKGRLVDYYFFSPSPSSLPPLSHSIIPRPPPTQSLPAPLPLNHFPHPSHSIIPASLPLKHSHPPFTQSLPPPSRSITPAPLPLNHSLSPSHSITPAPLPLRDEQYRLLWSELQDLVELFASSSENHRVLAESVGQAAAHSPGMQLARKTPTGKAGGTAAMTIQWPGENADTLSLSLTLREGGRLFTPGPRTSSSCHTLRAGLAGSG